MLLFHTTPGVNAPSIDRSGLLVTSSKGAIRRIWLHTPAMRSWALFHLSKHHHLEPKDFLTITVSVPRAWVRRLRSGIWVSARDIPPIRIHGSPCWSRLICDATRDRHAYEAMLYGTAFDDEC